jgi:hypothetical protein
MVIRLPMEQREHRGDDGVENALGLGGLSPAPGALGSAPAHLLPH